MLRENLPIEGSFSKSQDSDNEPTKEAERQEMEFENTNEDMVQTTGIVFVEYPHHAMRITGGFLVCSEKLLLSILLPLESGMGQRLLGI